MTRLAVILVGLALVVAGCGGTTASSVANLGTTAPTASTVTNPAGSSIRQDELKFSECMRAHGVPNYPDPSSGGGFEVSPNSGIDPSSPAVQRAQAKCHRYLPAGGGIAPGSQTHPTSQWLAHMASIARCMRRHGVTDFPDPRTSIPSPLPANGMVSNIQGAVLVFQDGSELQ